MSNRALVITFNSDIELSSEVIRSLVRVVLAGSANPSGEIGVRQLNSEDIARILVQSTGQNTIQFKATQEPEPVVNAITYIGEKFKHTLLNSAGSNENFIAEFATYIATAKFTGHDPQMMTAMGIIRDCDNLSCVSTKLRRKYGMTQKILDCIKNIADNV